MLPVSSPAQSEARASLALKPLKGEELTGSSPTVGESSQSGLPATEILVSVPQARKIERRQSPEAFLRTAVPAEVAFNLLQG